MINLHSILLKPSESLRSAIRIIDASSMQIALVVDESLSLLGTVTDGDIRRGILAGYSLDGAVWGVMNKTPLCVTPNDDRRAVLELMKLRRVHQIPVVDDHGIVVGIETIDDLLLPVRRDNPVILMAGGLGNRLRPLTNDCPKPLLAIGNRPILETILNSFIEHGFHRFYISVNYMAEKIKDYFGDGSQWGVQIDYLEESERLGTAGALTLLPAVPELPIFVMNGDVLAKVNFAAMLDFHQRHAAAATLGIRQFSHTIPYGVVTVNDHHLVNIVEKPEQKVFVSSGIYLLSPHALTLIPEGQFYDMPSLFQRLVDEKLPATCFPVHEYWIDIGQLDDFERAGREYVGVFQ